MRKELFAIIIFILAIVTLASLLSYSAEDPSVHHARKTSFISNLFGLPGAYISGILIGLFGTGAFWIPIGILLFSIHIFCGHPIRILLKTIIGGMILTIATASLFLLIQTDYFFFGSPISSGGIIGIQFRAFLEKHFQFIGSVIILIILWIIAFILITGFPLIPFAIFCRKVMNGAARRVKTLFIIWKERNRRRIKKRESKFPKTPKGFENP